MSDRWHYHPFNRAARRWYRRWGVLIPLLLVALIVLSAYAAWGFEIPRSTVGVPGAPSLVIPCRLPQANEQLTVTLTPNPFSRELDITCRIKTTVSL